MTALVLDGESRAALEVVQSLGRAGIAVDVAAQDGACLTFKSRYPRSRLAQPQTTVELGAWLLERSDAYQLIVPTTENSLQAFRALRETSIPYLRALLPSQRSLEIALNKESTWQRAAALGVPVPASRLIEQGEAPPPVESLPIVLKPLRSVLQVDGVPVRFAPVIVRSEDERNRHLARFLPHTAVQEQAYVRGRGAGVECLYGHGHLQWCFVHERVHEVPLTGGGSSYRRSILPPADLVAMTRRLLDELEWHGVAMVEYKRAEDGSWYLMEINPRLWGSLALAIDAGVDFPLGMWRLATGQPIAPQPRYRVTYYSRNLSSDIDWFKENLRADPRDPLLLTQPRLRSLLEYLRPLALRESWDHFDWRDLRVTAAQLGEIVARHVRVIASRLERHRNGLQLRWRHLRLERQLREGRRPVARILFLCYGNICRSPFAEACAARVLPQTMVESAGFYETAGRHSPGHLQSGAAQLGIQLSAHRSRTLDATMIEQADLIIVMDLENYRELLGRYPAAADKAAALGLFGTKKALEIEDPYTFDETRTRLVLEQIDDSVRALSSMLSAVLRDQLAN